MKARLRAWCGDCPDKPERWCIKGTIALSPDTLIVDPIAHQGEILWRGLFDWNGPDGKPIAWRLAQSWKEPCDMANPIATKNGICFAFPDVLNTPGGAIHGTDALSEHCATVFGYGNGDERQCRRQTGDPQEQRDCLFIRW